MWSDSLKGNDYCFVYLVIKVVCWHSSDESAWISHAKWVKRNWIVVDLSASDPCYDCNLLLLSTTRHIFTINWPPPTGWLSHRLSDKNSSSSVSQWLTQPDKQLQDPRSTDTYQIDQIIVNYTTHTWSRQTSFILVESELFPLLRAPGVWSGHRVNMTITLCVIKRHGLAHAKSRLF